MGSSVVIMAIAVVAQAAAPASKTDTKTAQASRPGWATPSGCCERPLRRGGRSPDGDRGRREEKRREALTPALKVPLALGKAECQASQGEYARAIVRSQGRRRPRIPRTPTCSARLADLYLIRGEWEAAEAAMRQAAEARPRPLARALGRGPAARTSRRAREGRRRLEMVRRPLQRTTGARSSKNADALLLVGQAAERYYRANARGEELSDALNDVINEIYETALRVDPNCWQAPWLEGQLFLSGYNERSAVARAGPSPADQPAVARDPGDAGPGRLAGLPPGGRPSQGRAGPGDQPAFRRRPRSSSPT